MLKISVVIIAKDAPKIKYTLESLAKQNLKPFEILVIVPSKDDISLNR